MVRKGEGLESLVEVDRYTGNGVVLELRTRKTNINYLYIIENQSTKLIGKIKIVSTIMIISNTRHQAFLHSDTSCLQVFLKDEQEATP